MSPLRWLPADLPAAVVSLVVQAGAAYVGLADGRVLRAPDGPGAWHLAADVGAPVAVVLATPSGLLLGGAEGLRRIAPDGRRSRVAGLPDAASVVALARAGRAIVAGTRARGVFRSADGGATWDAANRGLPYRGVGLGVTGFATTRRSLLVAHPLGVSRSRDGGRSWGPAAAGLPLHLGRIAVTSSGPHVFAEADGRLFHLDGDLWTEWGSVGVGLLGADAHALFGIDAHEGLVWCPSDGGPWETYGQGLPAAPWALACGVWWRWAALDAGGLWRCPVTVPPHAEPGPTLTGVPPFLTRAPAVVTVALATPADVVLTLADTEGEEVARLFDGPLAAGEHRLALDAAGLRPGLYRCCLRADGRAVSHPLAVLP